MRAALGSRYRRRGSTPVSARGGGRGVCLVAEVRAGAHLLQPERDLRRRPVVDSLPRREVTPRRILGPGLACTGASVAGRAHVGRGGCDEERAGREEHAGAASAPPAGARKGPTPRSSLGEVTGHRCCGTGPRGARAALRVVANRALHALSSGASLLEFLARGAGPAAPSPEHRHRHGSGASDNTLLAGAFGCERSSAHSSARLPPSLPVAAAVGHRRLRVRPASRSLSSGNSTT